MLRFTYVLSVFLILIFSPVTSVAQSDTRDSIKTAETLGRLIYEHDQAAWHGTDKLREDMEKNGIISGLKGWVTVPEQRGVSVKFIAEIDGELFSVWEATVRKSKVRNWERLENPRPLSEQELALFKARTSTPITKEELCTNNLPLNTVVFPVPDDPDGKLYAYFLSSPKKYGDIVIGKHFRYTLNAQGDEVLDRKTFTNSCLTLNPFVSIPKGAKPEGMTVTHLLSTTPEEHHVFANLSAKIPLYVGMTQTDEIYVIKNGRMRRLNK